MKTIIKKGLLFLSFGILSAMGYSQNVPHKEIPISKEQQHTCSRGIPLVTHFSTNATSTSDWSNFVDLSLTGTAKISETTETTSITMYPNPAIDRVYFNTNQEDTKNTTITIYDSFGKLIATIKNQNSYSVEKLAKGLYFVKIATGTFEETKKLFIE